MQRLILRHGDCVDVLGEYEDASVGAVVSDPPYHISFMGKTWDAEGAGIAFSPRLWDEVYRVLRPGGVVKAFSGTRTFHRMAQAMHEVGFIDLRIESWNYGSGFPKSLNIGMALDKAARGNPQGSYDPLKRGGEGRPDRNVLNMGGKDGQAPTGLSDDYGDRVLVTPDALRFQGWGTALKPAWEPVVVGRKPDA